MKKSLLIIAMALVCSNIFAQEKTYLLFEFMKVDNDQEQAYWETEDFWEKIHQERVKNGDILGWDLWSLRPGGEDQGYQYMTVGVYNDPVKMFANEGDFGAALANAYPNMSEEEIQMKMQETVKSRDLAIRLYVEIISGTKGDFKMELGSIAAMDFMKADNGGSYEKAEIETFLPMHQKEVDAGTKGRWSLMRVMSPSGSDVYASHITVNMFTGFDQVFNSPDMYNEQNFSELEMKAIEDGIKTRDLKKTIIATLVKQVKK